MPVAGELMGKLEPDAAGAAGGDRGFVHSSAFACRVPCGFPSGHAMVVAMVYLTLGILLARTQPKKRVRAFIVIVSMLITLLAGTAGSI